MNRHHSTHKGARTKPQMPHLTLQTVPLSCHQFSQLKGSFSQLRSLKRGGCVKVYLPATLQPAKRSLFVTNVTSASSAHLPFSHAAVSQRRARSSSHVKFKCPTCGEVLQPANTLPDAPAGSQSKHNNRRHKTTAEVIPARKPSNRALRRAAATGGAIPEDQPTNQKITTPHRPAIPSVAAARELRCSGGHSVSVARQGHVHLMPRGRLQKGESGDSEDMVIHSSGDV